MKRKAFVIIGLAMFLVSASLAQSGDKYFDKKEYRTAAAMYEREVKSDPSKNLNLAKCYIALQQFDEASAALANYSGSQDEEARKLKELVDRDDEPVRIKNLGSTVNSGESEYLPVISADGKRLYFCSKKSGGKGGEDIWYTDKLPDGSWSEPKNFSSLNTSSHEALMSISADGSVAIVFGNYSGSFGNGDLFYSVKTASGWSVPCNLGGDVNTDGWESQANLAADGKTLLFTSSRNGTHGNGDIWMTQLSEKKWSKPINLGSVINTASSEGSPQLAADGKTLYFKSNGHFGFGGYDVFMSKRLDDSWINWSEPVNLGKYINTMEDDAYLAIPSSGVKAYINKSNQLDGNGGSDLYEFVLPLSMRPEATINVYGRISDENDGNVNAIVRYYGFDSGEEVAFTQSNPADGIYKVSLPMYKKYKVVIDMQGYLYHTSILDLTDPEAIWGKEYINDVIGTGRMNKLRQIKQEMDILSAELDKLIKANSPDVMEAFKKYEELAEKYRKAAVELENELYDAKWDYLGREDVRTDVEHNYELQSITVGAKFELRNIFFQSGSATLEQESKIELNKLVDIMNRSRIIIELGGYTDSVGGEAANLKLSQERVNSVKAYLVSEGISQDRILAVGYGEANPVATNKTPEGRAQNRRVEVKITEIIREGKDIAGNYEEPEEEEEFDVLGALQRAARKGGVPKGSYCSDKVVIIDEEDDNPDWAPDNKGGGNFPITPGGRDDFFSRKDYIYGGFNLSLKNFGFRNPMQERYPITPNRWDFWGAEMNLVSQKYNEVQLRYWFRGSEGGAGGFGLSQLWTIRMHKLTGLNLNLAFGYDADVFGVNAIQTDPDDPEPTEGRGFLTIPVGVRYVQSIGSLKIAPEVFYNYGLGGPSDWPSATHIRIGGNVRWKIFQGGAFLNMGEEIRYFGLRGGIAF